MLLPPPSSTLFPYTTLFRSDPRGPHGPAHAVVHRRPGGRIPLRERSEEHTSELQHPSISYAVFCLKKKKHKTQIRAASVAQTTVVCIEDYYGILSEGYRADI